jgi:lipopolysaccharide biosynthesis glycosyltransferase
MEKELLNVVYACDNNYAHMLGVSAYSMLDNFRSDRYRIKINIFDGGIDDNNKKKLEKIFNKFDTPFEYYSITNEVFKDCPVTHHVTVATFYRLVIPEKIAQDVSKVLYIDCDTLVVDNIEPLFLHDITNYYFGAVKDFVQDSVFQLPNKYYKFMTKYFNGGLLLMNLDKLRREHIQEQWFDFLKNHAHELIYPDQDTVSYICRNDWLVLDPIWNFQVDRSQEKVTPAPKILHYTMAYKPGYRFYRNAYSKPYYKYLKLAWPDYKMKPVPSLWIAFKQLIKYIPFSVPLVRAIKKPLKIGYM